MPSNEDRRQAAKRKLERQLERRATKARKRKQLTIAGGIAIVVVVGVGVYLWSSSDKPTQSSSPTATNTGTKTGNATPAGACMYPTDSKSSAAKKVTAPTNLDPEKTGTVPALITTSAGPIPLTLDRAQAPCTVENFVSLTEQKYYDDTKCHRLTTGGLSVLQCGDPQGTGTGGPGYSIPDEFPTAAPFTENLYPRGTVAMAKTQAPNSGGSQFFLVYADSQLPPQYTVFGTITEDGLQTLDAIAAQGTATGESDGEPKTPVQIQSVTIE